MEKFYIVPEGTELHKEATEYRQNAKDVNDFVRQFFPANNIETSEYCACSDRLYIVPTKNDKENFKTQLMLKAENNGLRGFKINSKVNKNWRKELCERKLSINHRPLVQFCFTACARGSSRLFFDHDILYCSYENEDDFSDPEGFIPMNGSDFYKVIEEQERRSWGVD